jgi:hypothetical protein
VLRGAVATAANAAWFVSALPAERRFRAALQDPRRAQEAILRRYLARNADTVFGRRHGFSEIRTTEQYQRRVPLHDYDSLASDIDRIAAGEPAILTADRVTRLATSSGSTAARKLIPYTSELQREFDRAIAPWIVDLFREDPQLACGCAYWSITPLASQPQRRSKAGPPIGFEEDSAYLGGVRKRLVDAVMAVPADVRHIADGTAFRKATLAHLLRRRDLRLISVWHPSFLELLLDALESDIDWRAQWPNLRLVSCWGDAHAAAPAAALARRLPAGVRIQPKGLLATEAFVTVPYGGARPLAVRSHFFEFLDEGDTARLVDELQPGKTYSVVVTTAGGLWRYRLGDLVKVEGLVARTPSLRFIGREDGVSDHFGEKLSERFVGDAIRDVLAMAEVIAPFAMLAPDETATAFRYSLFIQETNELPRDLAMRLDAALRANPHYDHCRAIGQLALPGIFIIRGNAFAQYSAELSRGGLRLGDIKPVPLSRTAIWDSVFRGSWVCETTSAAL